MKKKSYVLTIICLMVFVALFAGCGMINTTTNSGEIYYEYVNENLNYNSWIALSSESFEWNNSKGNEGVIVEDGSQYKLVNNKKQVMYLAVVDTGILALTDENSTKVYYQKGYNPTNTSKSVVNLYYVAKNAGYNGSLDELIELFKGEDGQDGIGIQGIAKTKTEGLVDTYTITLTDGKKYTFTVTNGEGTVLQEITVDDLYNTAKENGFTGSMNDFLKEYITDKAGVEGVGIKSITKTKTEDNIDTYTITLTDNTTYDFEITNGIDGKDLYNQVTAESLYEKAVEEGYEGTYLEWLKEYLGKVSEDDLSVYAEAQLSTVTIISTDSSSMYSGSGVIFSLDKEKGDAYIVTAYHMIYSSNTRSIMTNVYAYTYGQMIKSKETALGYTYDFEKAIQCEVIGGSAIFDTAVLKVTNSEYIKNNLVREAKIADSNKLVAGQTVIASGNPESTQIGVTKGIITYVSENVDWTRVDNSASITSRFIRIDAALNHGNSGGGVYKLDGEVVGIVCGGLTPNSTTNIGYLVPANICFGIAKNIIWQYEENAENAPYKIYKPLFGLTSQVDDTEASFNELTGELVTIQHVKIVDVAENSIFVNDIKVGDFVKTVAINGVEYEINSSYALVDLSYIMKVGDTIKYTVLRTITEEINNETTTREEIVEFSAVIPVSCMINVD